RLDYRRVLDRADDDGLGALALHAGPRGAQRDDPGLHPVQDVLAAPAGLLLDDRFLVLVAEQVRGALDQRAHRVTVEEGDLLGEVGGELQTRGAAVGREPLHADRVARADHHQVDRVGVGQRDDVDLAVFAHRARVERGDLVAHLVVRGGEPGRVPGRRRAHTGGVHAMLGKPGRVLREVLADRADEQRAQAKAAQTERDVAGHAAAPDLQVADEERYRDLVQLLGDQRVRELAREHHQVVGRDRPGDCNPHLWRALFSYRGLPAAGSVE